MEIMLIIAAIIIAIIAVLYSALRIAELEQKLMTSDSALRNLLKTQNSRVADRLDDASGNVARLEKVVVACHEALSNLQVQFDELESDFDNRDLDSLDYKNETIKAAKAYIYLEMCYLRNEMRNGNIDTMCEHLKQESAGELYSKDLLAKGDMADHE